MPLGQKKGTMGRPAGCVIKKADGGPLPVTKSFCVIAKRVRETPLLVYLLFLGGGGEKSRFLDKPTPPPPDL